MSDQDYQRLIVEYGEELAKQIKEWYVSTYTTGFRACISDVVRWCNEHELEWR